MAELALEAFCTLPNSEVLTDYGLGVNAYSKDLGLCITSVLVSLSPSSMHLVFSVASSCFNNKHACVPDTRIAVTQECVL